MINWNPIVIYYFVFNYRIFLCSAVVVIYYYYYYYYLVLFTQSAASSHNRLIACKSSMNEWHQGCLSWSCFCFPWAGIHSMVAFSKRSGDWYSMWPVNRNRSMAVRWWTLLEIRSCYYIFKIQCKHLCWKTFSQVMIAVDDFHISLA